MGDFCKKSRNRSIFVFPCPHFGAHGFYKNRRCPSYEFYSSLHCIIYHSYSKNQYQQQFITIEDTCTVTATEYRQSLSLN
jgi:hypothetical protein